MFRHHETRQMPYPAELLFDLVLDIESYPQFLPWCKAARIRIHEGNVITADLIVGKGMISERFRSRVCYDRKKMTIDTEYIEGPLEFMKSHWYFTAKGKAQDSSELDFSVEFAFRHGFLQRIFQTLFEKATLRMIESFENRAAELRATQSVVQKTEG